MRDAFSGIVDLERDSVISLYRQLYEQLRGGILDGRLTAGTRIPASRAMAQQLGVARNTVLNAVDQLVAEGYLEARQGSGTVVSNRLSGELVQSGLDRHGGKRRRHELSRSGQILSGIQRDSGLGEMPRPFMPGIPDNRAFPSETWSRLLRRASREMGATEAAYGAMGGLPKLREALASHLHEARGVRAEPDYIVITSSAQAALDLLARCLLDPGDAVWIEDPGYLGARAAFAGAGAELVPVPVDADGLNPHGIYKRPRMIYVTPSHQYPTGRLMPLARRLELLDAAERHNAYVLEDDYDSEFQFAGRPVAALQGLDRDDRVLYVGSFSKILQPGIRAGYMVVPEELAEPLVRMQRNTGHVVPAAIQHALADFIAEGHLRAHIRRICTLYEERQALLRELISQHLPRQFTVEVPAGGMQFIAELKGRKDDAGISKALGAEGIVARPVSRFYLGKPVRHGFLTGFAGYTHDELERAIVSVKRVLGS